MRHAGQLILICAGAAVLAACDSSSKVDGAPTPPGIDAACPSARLVLGEADMVPGPLARAQLNDLVLENDRLRAIIQKPGRNWFSIAQFGGNIIDAVPKDSRGRLAAEDQFEELALGTNVESSPNYQSVEVIEAGGRDAQGNCQRAVIRATGPDDLLDFVNGSSAIRDMGFTFPAMADDVDLPVTIRTDYILEPGQRFITMQSTLINESDQTVDLYMVEYLSGSGEVELFQHGYGFGEALVTAPCDSCRYAAYAGHDGGAGVSYGVVHPFARSSSLSVSGVSVLVYGTDALPLFLPIPEPIGGAGIEPPPFSIPASGELTLSRWFVVGDGSVSSIVEVKQALLDEPVGRISGRIMDAAGPVAGAEISAIGGADDFERLPANLPLPVDLLPLPSLLRGPDLLVANHARTDAQGRYSMTLAPGTYELRVNVPGRLATDPATVEIDLAEGDELSQDFTAPLPARLRVRVLDENDQPVAAKLQLIGEDLSPDAGEPQNSESVLGGLLTLQSGVFGDILADKLPNGVVLSEFAVRDTGSGSVSVGDSGVLDIEPGSYQLSVSHGPRYNEFVQDLTLNEGVLTDINARVVRVIDTSGWISGDFHVHSFDSPDAEVTNRERVATYLAEDMDFFTPSDHGMRVDFEPVIADMGVTDLIASAPSAEITTFDYGHFNAWPVAVDPSPPSLREPSQSMDPGLANGSVDWGGAAPAGQDFPAAGHYVLTPEQIIATAKAEPLQAQRAVVAQINHIDSHFGAVGLGIDTGQTPPQSSTDPTTRRLPPDAGNLFTSNFDSLELWIGVDGRTHQFEHFLGENAPDWFNLLNQGILKTFVANSDTHDRRLTSLSTRNLISVPSALNEAGHADPAKLRADPHAVADAIIAGHSVGSNAPFLRVTARNPQGQIAGLAQDDAFGVRTRPLPLASSEDAVTLELEVQSPLWAEFDQVLVFVNSATTPQTDQFGQPVDPARYALCAPAQSAELDEGDFTRLRVPAANINDTVFERFEALVEFSLPNPGEDYWVVVMVQGRDGLSRPLWPVVPNDFTDGDGDLNSRSTDDIGTVALAVTNPIYVDADGDGQWTAPGLQISEDCNGGGLLGLPLPGDLLGGLPLKHLHQH